MDKFSDIRPYNDSEVAEVLQRLLANRELLDTMAKLQSKKLQRLFPALLRVVVKLVLKSQLKGVHDVRSFQHVVKRYMDEMIEKTTTNFTVSGLDQLDPTQAYLFISNHRDIALDPAFVNYAMYHNGGETVRIAIGDNLLSRPFAADLMRLNKSFIVKRSAKGRQMLAAFKTLAEYIRYSLQEENEPIWLAQREGRAKDGLDETEPAIIKMLCMSMDRKNEDFSAFIRGLRIVPVAISYEWDPCDGAKARELTLRETEGRYLKAELEDLQSIGLGISGHKGHVHVHFGEMLNGDYESPDAVAAVIDQQVLGHYRLHPSNLWAYEISTGSRDWQSLPASCLPEADALSAASRQAFEQRIQAMPEAYRAKAIAIYANVVKAKLGKS